MTANTTANDAAVRRSQPHPFAGFVHLLRFMVRRDRLRAPIWIGAVLGLAVGSAASVVALYDTPAQLQWYGDLATSQTALKLLAGPGYGLDAPTRGAVVMNEIQMYSYIGIALMSVFLLVRHTRAEEETDRAELVRAARVGRLAILTAAVTWIVLINALVAVGLFVGLLALGVPAVGSLAYAASGLGLGLFFIGVAAVTAQVASSARAATTMASGFLGVSFLIRGVGDLGAAALLWLSPLGWAVNIRAFAGERWWILALLVATAAGLTYLATMLAAHRDLGAGILRQRPGPAVGSPRLASPLAMAARLQRPALIGWVVGLTTIGFFFGLVANEADAILENEALADIVAQAGGGSPVDAFLATMILMLGLLASGFTIASVLRMRSEENAGRVSPVVAAPVGRSRFMLSGLMVSLGGSAVVVMAGGLSLGVGAAVQGGNGEDIGRLLVASLNLLPALFVLGSVAAALIGVRPGIASVAWAGLAVAAVVGLLAETLQLPQWLRDVSPFEHPASLPAESFDLIPVLILAVITLGLVGVGLMGMNRRDIET